MKPCVEERRRLSKAWLQVREHLSPDFAGQDHKTSLIICAVVVLQRLSVMLGQANKICVLQAPKPFEADASAGFQKLLTTRCVNARSAV